MVKKNKRGDRGSTEDESNVNSWNITMHTKLMNKLEIDLAELKSSFKTQETKLKKYTRGAKRSA